MVMKCPYCGKALELKIVQTKYTYIIKKYHIANYGIPSQFSKEVKNSSNQKKELYLVCTNENCNHELAYEYKDGVIKLYPYVYGSFRITLAEYITRAYGNIEEETIKIFAKNQKIKYYTVRDFINGKNPFLSKDIFNNIVQLFDAPVDLKERWKEISVKDFL